MGGKGRSSPDRPMCECMCDAVLWRKVGSTITTNRFVVLMQHGTPGHLGMSLTQDIREKCLDSASASPTPSAMRQDEPVAVWRDMAADEFLFHGPWPVG